MREERSDRYTASEDGALNWFHGYKPLCARNGQNNTKDADDALPGYYVTRYSRAVNVRLAALAGSGLLFMPAVAHNGGTRCGDDRCRRTSRARAQWAPMDAEAVAEYHAHVYYDPATTRGKAERLRERIAEKFPGCSTRALATSTSGRIRARPIRWVSCCDARVVRAVDHAQP